MAIVADKLFIVVHHTKTPVPTSCLFNMTIFKRKEFRETDNKAFKMNANNLSYLSGFITIRGDIGGRIMCDRNWQMERTKFVLTQRNNDTFSGDAQNKGKNPSLQEKKHQYLDRYFKRVK